MSVTCTWGNGANMSVGPLPGRKRIALYTIRGTMLEVLAYFPSESHAAEFCRIAWQVTYPDAEPYSAPTTIAG